MKPSIVLYVSFVLSVASVRGNTNTDLTRNVQEMSDRDMMEILLTRVSRLEADNIRQEKRIVDLEDTVVKQAEVIKSLQKVTEENGSDEGIHTDADVTDNSENEATFHQSAKQKSKRDKLTRNISLKRSMGRSRRLLPAARVAFSSLLSHDLEHLGANQNIVFDHTFVNTNNVYSPHHGDFTVPVAGIYVITATVLANPGGEVWCYIVVNGAVTGRIYARGSDNKHDQGSQTILLPLNRDDAVSIQNVNADDSVHGNSYTTFSGFLLFEEGSIAIVG